MSRDVRDMGAGAHFSGCPLFVIPNAALSREDSAVSGYDMSPTVRKVDAIGAPLRPGAHPSRFLRRVEFHGCLQFVI